MEGWIDEDSDPEYNSKAKKKVTFNITKDKQSKTHKGSTSNNEGEIEPQETTRAIDNSGENITLEEIKATRERIQKAIKGEQKVKNALKKLNTS